MDIREKIGQRLVFGFPGTTIRPEFAALVREYKIETSSSSGTTSKACRSSRGCAPIFRSLSAARPGATPLSPSTRRAAW